MGAKSSKKSEQTDFLGCITLEELPTEILCEVCHYLSPADVMYFSSCCQGLHSVFARDETMWKLKFLEYASQYTEWEVSRHCFGHGFDATMDDRPPGSWRRLCLSFVALKEPGELRTRSLVDAAQARLAEAEELEVLSASLTGRARRSERKRRASDLFCQAAAMFANGGAFIEAGATYERASQLSSDAYIDEQAAQSYLKAGTVEGDASGRRCYLAAAEAYRKKKSIVAAAKCYHQCAGTFFQRGALTSQHPMWEEWLMHGSSTTVSVSDDECGWESGHAAEMLSQAVKLYGEVNFTDMSAPTIFEYSRACFTLAFLSVLSSSFAVAAEHFCLLARFPADFAAASSNTTACTFLALAGLCVLCDRGCDAVRQEARVWEGATHFADSRQSLALFGLVNHVELLTSLPSRSVEAFQDTTKDFMRTLALDQRGSALASHCFWYIVAPLLAEDHRKERNDEVEEHEENTEGEDDSDE